MADCLAGGDLGHDTGKQKEEKEKKKKKREDGLESDLTAC